MELRTDRFKFKDLFPDKAKKYAQKLHIKADEIEFVRKGIPIDPKDIEVKEGERAAIRYVTTPHLDRDSEILIPTGAVLDDFRQSPSVLYAHDYKGLPIGKDLWIKPTGKGVLAKTQYAKHQFAEDVYQCVRGKFLNSNSVGFIPVESVNQDDKKAFADWQDTLEKEFEIPKDESGKAKNIYTKWIMLEHSDVPVASNAQSLNVAVSKGDLPIQSERLKKDLEIEVVKDEKDREIEITIEDVEDKAKFKKKIEDKFTEEMSEDLKKHLDEQDEKFIHGDKEIEVEIGGTISSEPDIDIKEATKDITELLVIDKERVMKEKVGALAEKYKLSSKDGSLSVMDAVNAFSWKYGLDVDFDKEGKVVITKPETTENYHRIPVESPDKHKGHRIRTIVISASKGIKALYCGECKKVITYLFDVNKWSMEEAQAWVSEHKRGLERYERLLSEDSTEANLRRLEKQGILGEEKETETVGELTDELNQEETEVLGDKEIEIEKNKFTEEEKAEIEYRVEKGKEAIEELRKEKDRYVFAKKSAVQKMIDELEQNWDKLLGQKDEIITEKDEIIADLKEGRVLSRKNRKIVKDAIVALNKVLEADSAGSREDEETADGTITEREIEVVKENEDVDWITRDGLKKKEIKREFSKEDIVKVIKEISGEQMGEILEGAFKKSLDPEKIKTMVSEGIKVELQKLRGKVE